MRVFETLAKLSFSAPLFSASKAEIKKNYHSQLTNYAYPKSVK
jgi:hypothetical protein